MSRIDALTGFLEEDPNDSFSRYALAMEYIKLGQHTAGIEEFTNLIERNAAYVATYYQLAKAYERQGSLEEARRTYRKGIRTATEAGDSHTRDELQEALTLLESTF